MSTASRGVSLLGTGQVRGRLALEDVRDVLWTYHAPELYELLVLERGWSVDRYGLFLGEAMINAVIDGGAAGQLVMS
ncbi:MAG TPA: hypothetical protein VGP05_08125 [Pseudonocardia sp.]|nr:hypothetical protein [Pseudonocardia sp.]